jgi:hypothetical protein
MTETDTLNAVVAWSTHLGLKRTNRPNLGVRRRLVSQSDVIVAWQLTDPSHIPKRRRHQAFR